MAAHQNNLTEIQAGRAALKKSSNDVVRRHGQLFITDHTRLDADLRAVAQQLNVSLPSQPNAKQRATLASVSALSGTAFDAAWLRSQLTGHRQAKADGQRELSQGSDGQVKGLARAAAPVIQMHLDMLQEATGTPSGLATGNGGQAATRSGGRAGLGTGLLGLGGALVLAGGDPVAVTADAGQLPMEVAESSTATAARGSAGGWSAASKTATRTSPARRPAPPRPQPAAPARLIVDAAQMNVPVVPVGARDQGELTIPDQPRTVGWWVGSAPAGSRHGSSLFVGHVDSSRSGLGRSPSCGPCRWGPESCWRMCSGVATSTRWRPGAATPGTTSRPMSSTAGHVHS